MSTEQSTSHPRGLPVVNNYITTNSGAGKGTFTTPAESSTPHFKSLPNSESIFADLHLSPRIPVPLTPAVDLEATAEMVAINTGVASIPAPHGVGFRRTEMAPGGASPFHRTLSVDYGIVVAGEVELELEGGEKRVLRQGDTVVQRATMHRWRNMSDTEWVRMVWVMMPADEVVVDGKTLEEEWRIPGSTPKH